MSAQPIVRCSPPIRHVGYRIYQSWTVNHAPYWPTVPRGVRLLRVTVTVTTGASTMR